MDEELLELLRSGALSDLFPRDLETAIARSPHNLRNHGFLYTRPFLETGRVLFLAPSIETQGKLYLGVCPDFETRAYVRVWEYDLDDPAFRAAVEWEEGQGEPTGWIRCVHDPDQGIVGKQQDMLGALIHTAALITDLARWLGKRTKPGADPAPTTT